MRTTRAALRTWIPCTVLSLLAACSSGGGGGDGSLSNSAQTSTYAPDVATAWFDFLYDTVKTTSSGPPPASRIYGLASLALYESVVPGMPENKTLAGQLNDLPADALPTPVNEIHSWPIAANRALARVSAHFFAASQVDIDALEAAQLAALTGTNSQAVIDRSVQFGDDVADALIAWNDTDGFADLAACNAAYVPPLDPVDGGWVPTGPNQGYGALPCWGTLRCWAVTDADECGASGPPPYSTATTSEFYGYAQILYALTGVAGANLTPEQDLIARYWADNPGATGTPGGHWIQVVSVVAAQENLKLDTVAEAYARVGIAIHDAFITCWRTKYDFYLCRPVTYIQANIDPLWTPLLGTPGFPAYSSGHSTQSGAAASVLTDLFGPLAFTDTTHTTQNPALGVGDRDFDNFYEAASEAAASRLYGGIHWVFDNYDGVDQGVCIGETINANIEFRN